MPFWTYHGDSRSLGRNAAVVEDNQWHQSSSAASEYGFIGQDVDTYVNSMLVLVVAQGDVHTVRVLTRKSGLTAVIHSRETIGNC